MIKAIEIKSAKDCHNHSHFRVCLALFNKLVGSGCVQPIDQWRLESCETCNGEGCGFVWNDKIKEATCCDWQGKVNK